jgi:uncharacterized membrane protein YfcA
MKAALTKQNWCFSTQRILLLVSSAVLLLVPLLTANSYSLMNHTSSLVSFWQFGSMPPRHLNDNADNSNDDNAENENQNDDGKQEEEDEIDEEDEDEGRDDHKGLEFDDAVYIDDDLVDAYHAYEDDPSRPTLFPLRSKDVLGFLLSSMGVILASGGGIGGGGIVVPIYIIIMGLSPRDAIPISSVTVFGGALASLITNLPRRHPLADRPLVDWNLVLVMEPLILVGTMLGTLLHRIISEKLLVVLLVAMLSVTAHTILVKARRMYRAETIYIERLRDFHRRHDERMRERKAKANYLPPAVDTIEGTPTSSGDQDILPTHAPIVIEQIQDDGTEQVNDTLGSTVRQEIMILNPDFVSLRSEMMQEEKVTPRNKIIILCSMFSVLIFLNVMVGGGTFSSPWGISCGGVAFWVVHVIMASFLVASAWAAQTYLMNRHEIKQLVCFDYVHGDIQWDERNAILYPLVFCAAGLFAGIFGIGGGMICVPLLLTYGVHPMVATATSSVMIFFTSFMSVSSYAVFDLILWDYAAVCLVVGFFPTLLGQTLMRKARKIGKYNGQNFERNSIIAFSIGGVVLLSCFLMSVQYIFSIVKFEDGKDRRVCDGFRG